MAGFLIWLLFGGVMVAALPLTLLGLPGTWLLVVDALLLRWLKGPGPIDYHTVIILLIMALMGEAAEFFTALRGARSGLPVKGAGPAAILGAFAGGLIGVPVMFGLGAIPGMAAGAWCAVFVLAVTRGSTLSEASGAAMGAMAGRIKGTVLKMAVAVAMLAVIITALVI